MTDTTLSEDETMLRAQMRLLHDLFTQAAGRLLSATDERAVRHYGNFVLRAQSCCRQTLAQIAKLAAGRTRRTEDPAIKRGAKTPETGEPAIKETAHATMDASGTPAAIGIDPPVAPLGDGHTQV